MQSIRKLIVFLWHPCKEESYWMKEAGTILLVYLAPIKKSSQLKSWKGTVNGLIRNQVKDLG